MAQPLTINYKIGLIINCDRISYPVPTGTITIKKGSTVLKVILMSDPEITMGIG